MFYPGFLGDVLTLVLLATVWLGPLALTSILTARKGPRKGFLVGAVLQVALVLLIIALLMNR